MARTSKFYPFYIQTRWKIVLTVRRVTARFAKWNPSGNDDEQAPYHISWSHSPDVPNDIEWLSIVLRGQTELPREGSHSNSGFIYPVFIYTTQATVLEWIWMRMGKRGIKRKANLRSWCKGCHSSLIHRRPTHYRNADATLACERCCVTKGYLERLVWDIKGFS